MWKSVDSLPARIYKESKALRLLVVLILLTGCADLSSFAIGAGGSLLGNILSKELASEPEEELPCGRPE
jgi:hypothetical protein